MYKVHAHVDTTCLQYTKRKEKTTIYHNTKQAAGNMEPACTRLFIKLAGVRYTETCQCMPTKYMYIV